MGYPQMGPPQPEPLQQELYRQLAQLGQQMQLMQQQMQQQAVAPAPRPLAPAGEPIDIQAQLQQARRLAGQALSQQAEIGADGLPERPATTGQPAS